MVIYIYIIYYTYVHLISLLAMVVPQNQLTHYGAGGFTDTGILGVGLRQGEGGRLRGEWCCICQADRAVGVICELISNAHRSDIRLIGDVKQAIHLAPLVIQGSASHHVALYSAT